MNPSARSEANLVGVHPDLVRVIRDTPLIDECSRIEIVEGVRDIETQERYVKAGSSSTMNSRHLTGHATDFALYRDEDGDGDEDFIKAVDPYYRMQAELFKQTARKLGVGITWGGDWTNPYDGMHLQLSWGAYPIGAKQKTTVNSTTIAAAGAGIPIAAFVPELLAKAKELIGSLSFLDASWISGIQIAILLFIAGYIVLERKRKIEQEGS